jgi:hypothetical protein
MRMRTVISAVPIFVTTAYLLSAGCTAETGNSETVAESQVATTEENSLSGTPDKNTTSEPGASINTTRCIWTYSGSDSCRELCPQLPWATCCKSNTCPAPPVSGKSCDPSKKEERLCTSLLRGNDTLDYYICTCF